MNENETTVFCVYEHSDNSFLKGKHFVTLA